MTPCGPSRRWVASGVALWHAEHDLRDVDAVILPGGFSYGDYLRCGAIAGHAPIMDEVKAFADRGGPVLGICNGFQILCEAGLLPGALIRNRSMRFVCREVFLRVETSESVVTGGSPVGEVLAIPIKHGEGQFVAGAADLRRIEDEGLVAFRYCDDDGRCRRPSQPERFDRSHRGRAQCRRQRGWAHAPSRACGRSGRRSHRRSTVVRIAARFAHGRSPTPSERPCERGRGSAAACTAVWA